MRTKSKKGSMIPLAPVFYAVTVAAKNGLI